MAIMTTSADEALPELPPVTAATLRERLVPPITGSRWVGWIGPIGATVLGFILRVWGVGSPHGIIFDEVYYVHDSMDLHKYGVERDATHGDVGAGYVVHPPLGKWMISLGYYFFHYSQSAWNPAAPDSNGKIQPFTYTGAFAWRISSVVFGSLAILLLARAARRMTRSNLLGTIAGLLLALDGLEFVSSRLALLDIFLMFWIVAGFACLVRDRDDVRERLALAVDNGQLPGRLFVGTGWRPWLLLTGVCTGAACAVKWDGVWFLPAYALLAVVWEIGSRRTAGGSPWAGTLRQSWWRIPAWMGVVPLAVYTVSWTGWFINSGKYAYLHDQYVKKGQGTFAHAIAVLHGWLTYHQNAFDFHRKLYSFHPYASRPISWLFQGRPVAYYYTSPTKGQDGCDYSKCAREVLGVGTTAIWYPAILALVVMLWWSIAKRDWRASGIMVCFAAAWASWLPFAAYFPGTGSRPRTSFTFYALTSVPFMILAVVMVLGTVLGRPDSSPTRRTWGAAAAGSYVLLVVIDFWYLWPILAAVSISVPGWQHRILFPSWI
jgi:dolichyl-phosphate-mannose-protein mannosyltransferase